jgi:hypothetical protein
MYKTFKAEEKFLNRRRNRKIAEGGSKRIPVKPFQEKRSSQGKVFRNVCP